MYGSVDSNGGKPNQSQLDYLEQRVEQLEQAMAEFVLRVENGEIRSNQTYKKFKDLLAA